jgi:hypothetical protein
MAVTVRHGVNQTTLNSLAGKTVAEVRSEVAGVLNVPPSAQVRVNGAIADDTHIVGENATIEFVKVAGEKGVVGCSV